MKRQFTQPVPPAWIEALLSRAWSQEASLLIDQWLIAVEKHLEEKSA